MTLLLNQKKVQKCGNLGRENGHTGYHIHHRGTHGTILERGNDVRGMEKMPMCIDYCDFEHFHSD